MKQHDYVQHQFTCTEEAVSTEIIKEMRIEMKNNKQLTKKKIAAKQLI